MIKHAKKLAASLTVAAMFGCNPNTPVSGESFPSASASRSSIEIVGDVACHDDVGDALNLLQVKDPAQYVLVVGAVGIIECVKKGSGMLAFEEPPRFLLGDVTRDSSTTWLAGTIVHDACHSQLYHDYLDTHSPPVPDDVWTGAESEAICVDAQVGSMQRIGAPVKEVALLEDILESRYWEIPYEQRNW